MARRRRAPGGTARADAADWKAERLTDRGFGADATDGKRPAGIDGIPCADGKPCQAPGTRPLRRRGSRVPPADGGMGDGLCAGAPRPALEEGARLRGPGPSRPGKPIRLRALQGRPGRLRGRTAPGLRRQLLRQLQDGGPGPTLKKEKPCKTDTGAMSRSEAGTVIFPL